MRLRMARISNWIARGLLLGCASARSLETSTAAQDSAPKYVQESDGKVSVLCMDIMRAIESIEPAARFTGAQKFLPCKRIERDLRIGPSDAFFGFSSSAQRGIDYEFVTISAMGNEFQPVQSSCSKRQHNRFNLKSPLQQERPLQNG